MPKPTFYNLSAARRARIEAVAIDEFSKNGLKSAVLNNIVAKSGIAKGSFYQYFENIEDLYQHILSLVQKRKTDVASS
ncbi:MAG TPA: TetR/AcrR family transcriptional regulator, partial [Anaerolineaceae bacterium]|nr:TetR/AcrR family transcriptional regulator [Anaerolineaceae bacterium]